MDFSRVLRELRNGKKVRREGWDIGSHVVYISDRDRNWKLSTTGTGELVRQRTGVRVHISPYLLRRRGLTNDYAMWGPEVEDLFAEDWLVVL
ncbi:MAG: MW1434 family type I TA system toxin [Euryarchaeota archaeon]|nr:MW1434 family type I TA system toxin [Euryarchaeota archaeon]